MKFKTCVHVVALVCLVLLSSAQVSALDCHFLKLRQKEFNLHSLELWREMRTKFPPECLEKTAAFNFPAKILEIRESRPATEAIYEILHGFLHILSSDSLQTGWKDTHRERSLQMLHAQAEAIKRCLGGRRITPGRAKEWRSKLELKKYFRRIRSFLRENGGSACCWESLRQEARAGLTYVDILTKRMKS